MNIYFASTVNNCRLLKSQIIQIRIYHLGPGNVLQEYAYSDSEGWQYGNLHNLKIVLDPTSSLAAIRHLNGCKDVYYQGE